MIVSLHGVGILSRSTCIQEGWQYHSLVDFQLGVKVDSTSLSDICTESSKCHTGFCNSGNDHIINVHCSEESASQVGEFINFPLLYGFQVLDGVQPLSFCADCEIIVIT